MRVGRFSRIKVHSGSAPPATAKGHRGIHGTDLAQMSKAAEQPGKTQRWTIGHISQLKPPCDQHSGRLPPIASAGNRRRQKTKRGVHLWWSHVFLFTNLRIPGTIHKDSASTQDPLALRLPVARAAPAWTMDRGRYSHYRIRTKTRKGSRCACRQRAYREPFGSQTRRRIL